MKRYNFVNNIEIAYCLQPFHFIQFFLLHNRNKKAYVLIPNYKKFSKLFDYFSEIIFIPIEERKIFYKELKENIDSLKDINYFYAVPWNKTALKIEQLVLQVGNVFVLEDGLGNYNLKRQLGSEKSLYYFLHKIYYFFLGINYCETHYRKKMESINMSNIRFYSILPSKTGYCKDCKEIPKNNLPLLLNLEEKFSFPDEYRGLPVYFDTNDVEHNWLNLEKKIEILKSNLKEDRILYLPHPFQKYKLSNYMSNLIDVSDMTNSYNELFTYFIKPKKIYTQLSTSVFTLKNLFKIDSEIVILADAFFNATGKQAYKDGALSLQGLLK